MFRLPFLAGLVCLSGFWTVQARELSGDEIMAKVNEIVNPHSAKARMRMTVYDRQDRERTFVYDSWSVNHGEKNLVKYIEPVRVRGQAVLMLNNADDIWMYFPRTGRIRKLASHAKRQKMEGSDFSYEDMGAGDTFITDFEAKRLDDEKIEGESCFMIELSKKQGADIAYEKIIIWIRKTDYVPLRLDYYEAESENALKRLIQTDIKVIDGIPAATRMKMENFADGTRTEIVITDISFKTDIDENLFTERGMRP